MRSMFLSNQTDILPVLTSYTKILFYIGGSFHFLSVPIGLEIIYLSLQKLLTKLL